MTQILTAIFVIALVPACFGVANAQTLRACPNPPCYQQEQLFKRMELRQQRLNLEYQSKLDQQRSVKMLRMPEQPQLRNVNLQNSLTKMQPTLQSMSNISKMRYDAQQSQIRKIGG
jgi:hypothetical protein